MNQIESLESRRLLTALPAASDFVVLVNNPYMRLLPGATYIYRGIQDGKPAKNITSITHVLQTKEYTKLEPGVIEQKFYSRGIGFVRSVMTKGGTEFFNLVAIRY